ncbi:MAG: alpha/beta hydrolase [Ilumatobacteraceae bacterium]
MTTHSPTSTLTRRITVDGRTVVADVTGPDDGPVVVLFHAAPGSRQFDPDPVATAAAGVRLVVVDRPGYGGSDPLAAGTIPTITRYADDAAAVLDELGVTDAVLAGWSAGGRGAAAVAARRPELAAALLIVATPAPDDEVPWVPEEQRQAITMMKGDPAAAVGQMVEMLGAMADPAEVVASVAAGPADGAVLDGDDDLRQRLIAMAATAVAQGSIGVAADIVSYTVADWGFDPLSIGAPTTAVYGGADPVVSPAHGEWWAAQIPSAELVVVPDAGHLVITAAWPLVLAAARA